jgi:PIN domain nuclease of toxin-antitoxin system
MFAALWAVAEVCSGGPNPETRKQGLSLGDCICLTSAASADRVAVTAERRWKKLEGRQFGGVSLRVELIR